MLLRRKNREREAAIQRDVERFDHIVRFARELAERRPFRGEDAGPVTSEAITHRLKLLVRGLLRPLQSEHIISVVERDMHGAADALVARNFFCKSAPQLLDPCAYPKCLNQDYSVDLARDPVLPTPWKKQDFAKCLAMIGKGRACGEWRHDSMNHGVTVVLPWGIAFVTGGNHSIATGILNLEGSLPANSVFDMASALHDIHCNGRCYMQNETNEVVGEVSSYRTAAIFEIGRLMVRFGAKQVA